ncbi:precorrin-6Y C5,15-methyltransferase (decarboxylating) subunit CbiT [Fusobacterium perfoetens]|uniref:precorrin-6Y C5,15-methyltransferase (decarboxylating) subunit CbiT n=1 Tax=Fusobacterium perfoetens TaxID=852 RepID=UPI001F2B02E7|nr:precorrin-6Y C5,15-methyltransferase (decarboxylating) subunit CbiT [Fusobacterium perfoetens]MCF2624829.1 precorrin-6Y C5,15-methyltransferase (decarboxylating) subunit CbiT [Fusobacterium perfoetens]
MGHIADKEFIRGEVPMTKQEIRAVSVAKLRLEKDSVLIDVGAGTGSVGIEAATYISLGKVYAIEKKSEGIELIKENIKKFSIKNLEVIQGTAPDDLSIKKFNRMFVGGSSGRLDSIVEYFIKYSDEKSIIVINAITLETISEIKNIFEKYKITNSEIINMSVARGKKIGNYTMMYGENPIYIVTGEKGDFNE